jgi:DnaD/phage-associated family protein
VITSVVFTVRSGGESEPHSKAQSLPSEREASEPQMPGTAETEAALSRDRIAEVREQKDIKQLIYVAEQYLQRPLTSAEQNDFIYYYDTLNFSTDLIEYLLEYCISKGSANRHYMKKVALAWAEAGISSVLQAKQESNLYNKNYFTVLNTFGIKGRGPAAPERETMARWFDEFGFSIDIVLEACRRTIRQTHQPNFQYADKILVQWHDSGVASMSDVVQLDKKHQAQQAKPEQTPAKASSNRFNNFSQRQYDYNQLEKQLLNQ